MDLTLSQGRLALLLLSALATGAALGLLYDGLHLLRLLRGEGTHRRGPSPAKGEPRPTSVPPWPLRALTVTEDFLFALLFSVSLILLLYYTNDGQPRVLAVLGMASGFFIYHHTLGRPVRALSEGVVKLLRRLCATLGSLALWPCRQALRLVAFLWRRTVGIRIETRREKETEAAIRALCQRAGRGFPQESLPPPPKKNPPHKSPETGKNPLKDKERRHHGGPQEGKPSPRSRRGSAPRRGGE